MTYAQSSATPHKVPKVPLQFSEITVLIVATAKHSYHKKQTFSARKN